MSNNEEQELVTHILNGDTEQYAILIDRYKTGLYYHCFAITKDEDVAEDIAQETFIQAYRHLRKYDQTHRFSTWLYKIATNKALDYLRANRTIRLEDDVLNNLASTQPSAEKQMQHKELHTLVQSLPPVYCSVISLHYWQGKSYDEIATIMQVPVGSVKGWLHRAKKQLKEALS